MVNFSFSIILASGSPRRKELLAMAGVTFEVRTKNTDETHPPDTRAQDVPLVLAHRKAAAFANEIAQNEVVIGADTIVILENEIFEKPRNRDEAIVMLQKLSGQTHTVVTGVCMLSIDKKVVFSEHTQVTFNTLTDNEIIYYVDNYKPYDKAGSYACQEWIGAVAIKKFDGDYFNVVGLPVNRVYAELKKW